MKKFMAIVLVLVAAQFGYAQDNTAEEICPILVGTELPDATLRNIEGEEVQLHALTEGKATVIVLYRGGWCPYCNRQMKGLAVAEEELREMGFQVLAVSPDDPAHLSKTMNKHDLPYSLLSDSKMAFTDAIGVGFKVDDKTIRRYKTYGINLEKSSGEAHGRLPVPTVLLVDDEGTVHFVYANPVYKVRLNEGVLLAAAKAMLEK